MPARIGQPQQVLVPVAVAAVVALVGITTLLITERDPTDEARGNGITMITTATLVRAGAIAIPTARATPR